MLHYQYNAIESASDESEERDAHNLRLRYVRVFLIPSIYPGWRFSDRVAVLPSKQFIGTYNAARNDSSSRSAERR